MEKSYFYVDGKQTYASLSSDIETDVAIIGGGLAGIMCAHELISRGHSVVILERDIVGSGETARSSAMISYAHDLVYYRLIKKHGLDVAKQFLNLQRGGLKKIEDIISKNNIDCDYNNCDMQLFATTKKGVKELFKEESAYKELGEVVEICGETELPFAIRSSLKIKEQGYLNPYKFLISMANIVTKMGCKIYENSPVTSQPENNILKVLDFSVKAKSFVIATHFPIFNFPGFYFTKMFQSRSHNIVFKTSLKLNNIYESAEDDGFEYRPVKDGILCGGANIRTGKYKYNSQYKIVEENIEEVFSEQDYEIISRFSAQDCITFDLLPFVGQYSSILKNVYIISGFNKWGFTNSAAASDIIADIIEKKNTDNNIFCPSRLYFLNAPLKSAKNLGALVEGFAGLLISTDSKKIQRIKAGQGAVVRINGKRVGIYKDENNNIKAISAVCPHLGCALKYNKDECSWDCPCHGSRFDVDGNILNNPSIENAKNI